MNKIASSRLASPQLLALLDTSQSTRPTYQGDMSNHLPMVLCAMSGLGASTEQLDRFDATYRPRLEVWGHGALPLAIDELGSVPLDRELASGLAAGFAQAVAARGQADVLAHALDVLGRDGGSAAFHCMIRTAYGVEFGVPAEVAAGLSYWATTRESLGPLLEVSPPDDAEAMPGPSPAALLERIHHDPVWRDTDFRAEMISDRMLLVAAHPAFAAAASGLTVDDSTRPATLDAIAQVVLHLFATDSSFVSLHALTSTYALAILMPFSRNPNELVRHHWKSITAAYITLGAPKVLASIEHRDASWAQIAAAAIESDDDHDAKLVYACLQESRARNDDRYRDIASRRMGLP